MEPTCLGLLSSCQRITLTISYTNRPEINQKEVFLYGRYA